MRIPLWAGGRCPWIRSEFACERVLCASVRNACRCAAVPQCLCQCVRRWVGGNKYYVCRSVHAPTCIFRRSVFAFLFLHLRIYHLCTRQICISVRICMSVYRVYPYTHICLCAMMRIYMYEKLGQQPLCWGGRPAQGW